MAPPLRGHPLQVELEHLPVRLLLTRAEDLEGHLLEDLNQLVGDSITLVHYNIEGT